MIICFYFYYMYTFKLKIKYAQNFNFINQINLLNSNSIQLYIKYLNSFSL